MNEFTVCLCVLQSYSRSTTRCRCYTNEVNIKVYTWQPNKQKKKEKKDNQKDNCIYFAGRTAYKAMMDKSGRDKPKWPPLECVWWRQVCKRDGYKTELSDFGRWRRWWAQSKEDRIEGVIVGNTTGHRGGGNETMIWASDDKNLASN